MQPGDPRAAAHRLAIRAGTGSHNPQAARRHVLPEGYQRIRYAHRQFGNGGARSMHDLASATRRPLLRLGDTARFGAPGAETVGDAEPGFDLAQRCDAAVEAADVGLAADR